MDSVTERTQEGTAREALPPQAIASAIQIDPDKVRAHVDEVVRGTVEQTLNALLDAEADRLCHAGRYERSPDRQDTRAGSYERKLQTKAGEVKLTVPRLRKLPLETSIIELETSIIERYRRRESSVEEAKQRRRGVGGDVPGRCFDASGGGHQRRAKPCRTEALWGTRASASTVSELAQKVYGQIETWLARPIQGEHAYVYLDGIWLKRSWGGEVKNVAWVGRSPPTVLIAIGVDGEGFREVLGVCEGAKEDAESWRSFLRHLKERGLSGVRLFISDKCLGLLEALGEFYPQAAWQRCVVHFYRNAFTATPSGKIREVAAMLKAIHAQEDLASAQQKAAAVAGKLREMKLAKAADLVEQGIGETLSYMSFPREHWRCLRTNNPLERLNREVRRRTRVVGAFPDGKSALMLVSARLRHVAGTRWGLRRYLDMKRLTEEEPSQAAA
jgi:putative transposase